MMVEMISLKRSSAPIPDGTYVEVVRTLFDTRFTTLIMTVAFTGVGLLVVSETPDRPLEILIGLGLMAAAARIAVLLVYRKAATDETLDVSTARLLELRFAVIYLAFAAVFGAFTARAFMIAEPKAHTVLIGLLFGYGAGVAAGLSLRPWISVTAVIVAVTPTVVVALLSGDVDYQATAIVLAMFLTGGVVSMLARYRDTVRKMTMRRLFQTLARHDALTGLPNRLSLRERFGAATAANVATPMLAVHCLDLDRFKPVNDLYGHPTGDLLLKAVAERLNSVLRNGDFVARLGGDEFIVVQTGIRQPGEAELLARRIVRAVAQPYSIGGHDISVGTSVGFALSPRHGTDLDRLAGFADEALIEVKRSGGGIAEYKGPRIEAENRMTA